MQRQTYKEDVCWVVVDDAIPRTTEFVLSDFRKNWTIIHVNPKPAWIPGMNTQGRNIAAGLNALFKNYNPAGIKAIFIIEDDDYYKPVYLEEMMRYSGQYDLFGETRTIYYNVRFRRYIANANTVHASLFQTAFTPAVVYDVEKCLTDKFIDAALWARVRNRYLIVNNILSIGIKGMPGRGGIGAGHKSAMSMHNDLQLKQLIKLIGAEDAKLYEGYYGNSGQLQYPLLASRRL